MFLHLRGSEEGKRALIELTRFGRQLRRWRADAAKDEGLMKRKGLGRVVLGLCYANTAYTYVQFINPSNSQWVMIR